LPKLSQFKNGGEGEIRTHGPGITPDIQFRGDSEELEASFLRKITSYLRESEYLLIPGKLETLPFLLPHEYNVISEDGEGFLGSEIIKLEDGSFDLSIP